MTRILLALAAAVLVFVVTSSLYTVEETEQALLVRLGKPVEVFAFPYGDGGANPELTTELLRKTGYASACLYGGGPIRLPARDPFRLPRLAMGPETDLDAALRA